MYQEIKLCVITAKFTKDHQKFRECPTFNFPCFLFLLNLLNDVHIKIKEAREKRNSMRLGFSPLCCKIKLTTTRFASKKVAGGNSRYMKTDGAVK